MKNRDWLFSETLGVKVNGKANGAMAVKNTSNMKTQSMKKSNSLMMKNNLDRWRSHKEKMVSS